MRHFGGCDSCRAGLLSERLLARLLGHAIVDLRLGAVSVGLLSMPPGLLTVGVGIPDTEICRAVVQQGG